MDTMKFLNKIEKFPIVCAQDKCGFLHNPAWVSNLLNVYMNKTLMEIPWKMYNNPYTSHGSVALINTTHLKKNTPIRTSLFWTYVSTAKLSSSAEPLNKITTLKDSFNVG